MASARPNAIAPTDVFTRIANARDSSARKRCSVRLMLNLQRDRNQGSHGGEDCGTHRPHQAVILAFIARHCCHPSKHLRPLTLARGADGSSIHFDYKAGTQM